MIYFDAHLAQLTQVQETASTIHEKARKNFGGNYPRKNLQIALRTTKRLEARAY